MTYEYSLIDLKFGSSQSLQEASMLAEGLRRARERHPSYYEEKLFNELMRSLPCTSLETMALCVDNDGQVYFNLIKRADDDIVEDWQGKYHGRGVMIRNSEVENNSVEKAWQRLLKDEVGANLLSTPFDLITQPLDVGGRGKEISWTHVIQVPDTLQKSVYVPLEELSGINLIDHHKLIVSSVLNLLPIAMEENRFLVKELNGNANTKLTRKVAMKLWDSRNMFSLN